MKERKRRRAVLIPVLAGALVLVFCTAGVAAEEKITDSDITEAVEDEILFSPVVDFNNVTIQALEGVVTLNGSVSSVLAKERAVRLAETVKGVRSVVDQIQVDPYWDRTDWQIEQDAEKALLHDAATEAFEVTVEVKEGKAVLTGVVDSLQEKELTERVVAGVRGVREVKNSIQVDYKRQRPDSEIRKEIYEALRWDTLVDHGLIDVEVKDGEVVLQGTVGSAAEVRQARHDAWVSGVRRVDVSGLEVKPWAAEEDLRKDKYVDTPDAEIAEAIEDALSYDPRVSPFDVQPEVDVGTVTLRGAVDNVQAKKAAEKCARHTVGVVRVLNRIKVQPEPLSDEKIEENIQEALERDPLLEPYDLDVTVLGGTAYLYGNVHTYYDKGLADDKAARAEGVKGVKNFIDVEVPGPVTYDPYTDEYYPYTTDWYDYQPNFSFKSDKEILEDVRDELWWSPFVDSDQVEVSVEEGTVVLTGKVDTLEEKRDAAENAYEGGATWVRNQLEVK